LIAQRSQAHHHHNNPSIALAYEASAHHFNNHFERIIHNNNNNMNNNGGATAGIGSGVNYITSRHHQPTTARRSLTNWFVMNHHLVRPKMSRRYNGVMGVMGVVVAILVGIGQG
jgi:hypothetical protein